VSRDEAHELLNAAKAGLDVSRQAITVALLATGDLVLAERVYRQPDTTAPALFAEWVEA
jgi:23S rRNA G2445 N2-methylase RlmL